MLIVLLFSFMLLLLLLPLLLVAVAVLLGGLRCALVGGCGGVAWLVVVVVALPFGGWCCLG